MSTRLMLVLTLCGIGFTSDANEVVATPYEMPIEAVSEASELAVRCGGLMVAIDWLVDHETVLQNHPEWGAFYSNAGQAQRKKAILAFGLLNTFPNGAEHEGVQEAHKYRFRALKSAMERVSAAATRYGATWKAEKIRLLDAASQSMLLRDVSGCSKTWHQAVAAYRQLEDVFDHIHVDDLGDPTR